MPRTIDALGPVIHTGRDEQANREVEAILAELPRDHLARRAFLRGRATVEITHHLRERRDLTHRLMNTSWDHYRRTRAVTARSYRPRQ